MPLLKIADFDPNYSHVFGDRDIIHYSVYSDNHEKIGTVKNILVDQQTGEFRYLVVDLGFWIFGKSVLLPIGRARIHFDEQRVYAKALTKEQAERLPEFSDDLRIDPDYEEQVRSGFRGLALNTTNPLVNTDTYGHPLPQTAPYGPLATNTIATLSTPPDNYSPDPADDPARRDLFRYEDHPDLYGINETEHPSIRAYSEQLVNQFRHEQR
ncbi:PRC-barrel domain-containing protein [Leptolyngbya sp. AN03gr2]|uniref:PRC-barrel domain-containing protein n=1 Tax=unclassified Leptolyngbya TaxID=2650499 RepID=UPI003D312A32